MCGKSVCDECSKSMRRLCKKDKNFYRVCDYCDNKIGDRRTEELFRRILEEKDRAIVLFKQKTAELAGKIGDRHKRMDKLEQKYVESEQSSKRTEDELKQKMGNLDKMVKNLKDSKKSLENSLQQTRSIMKEREDELKAAEDKNSANLAKIEETKVLIENGKKQLKDYQEEYERKKAQLEGGNVKS